MKNTNREGVDVKFPHTQSIFHKRLHTKFNSNY